MSLTVSAADTADATVTDQAGGFLGDQGRFAVSRRAHIHHGKVDMTSGQALSLNIMYIVMMITLPRSRASPAPAVFNNVVSRVHSR